MQFYTRSIWFGKELTFLRHNITHIRSKTIQSEEKNNFPPTQKQNK